MKAYDFGKGEFREFALKDIHKIKSAEPKDAPEQMSKVDRVLQMLRMQPGYAGTCERATALITDMSTALRAIAYGECSTNLRGPPATAIMMEIARKALE